MITKLAYQNVKQQLSIYILYFTSLMISISSYYSFISFYYLNVNGQLSEKNTALFSNFINLVTIPALLLIIFMIFYASNFFITLKAKQFATYRLLGMPKKKLTQLLILENSFIGLISLSLGIGLGEILKRLVSYLIAPDFILLGLEVNNAVSISALIQTVLIFGAIFLCNAFFTIKKINKLKLKLLFEAEDKIILPQKLSKLGVLNKVVTISILLILDYNLLLNSLVQIASSSTLHATIIFVLIITTMLYCAFEFYNLLARGLKVVLTKKYLYKSCNNFTYSIISKKLDRLSKSIAMTSILLTLSFTAFAAATSLNSISQMSIPVTDYTVVSDNQHNIYIDTISDGNQTSQIILNQPMNLGFGLYDDLQKTIQITSESEFNKLQAQDVNLSGNQAAQVFFNQEATSINKQTYEYTDENAKYDNLTVDIIDTIYYPNSENDEYSGGLLVLDDQYIYDNYISSEKEYDALKEELATVIDSKNLYEYETLALPAKKESFVIRKASEFSELYTLQFDAQIPAITGNEAIYCGLDKTNFQTNSVLNIELQVVDVKPCISTTYYVSDEVFEQFEAIDTTGDDFLWQGYTSKQIAFNSSTPINIDDLFDPSSSLFVMKKIDSISSSVEQKLYLTMTGSFLGFIFFITLLSLLGLQITIDSVENQNEFKKLQRLGFSKKALNKSATTITSYFFVAPLIMLIINLPMFLLILMKVLNPTSTPIFDLNPQIFGFGQIGVIYVLLFILYLIYYLIGTYIYKKIAEKGII